MPRQKKISDMLTPKPNKKIEKNHTRKKKPNDAKDVGDNKLFDYSDEDEENLPVTFHDFETWTCVNDIARSFIYNDIKDSTRTEAQIKRVLAEPVIVATYAKEYYMVFYTRPEYRWDLELKKNTPDYVRNKIYDIPEKYKHRIKKLKSTKNIEESSTLAVEWEADLKNPQPSTSSRAAKFIQSKSKDPEPREPQLPKEENNNRLRVAESLLRNCRTYKKDALSHFPVDLETFANACHKDKILDDILRVASQGDMNKNEILRKDSIVCRRVFQNYYYAFYDNPDVRSIFPISLKPVPLFLKKKIEAVPSSEKITVEDSGRKRSLSNHDNHIHTPKRLKLPLTEEVQTEKVQTEEFLAEEFQTEEIQEEVQSVVQEEVQEKIQEEVQSVIQEKISEEVQSMVYEEVQEEVLDDNEESNVSDINDEILVKSFIDFLQKCSPPENASELEEEFPLTFVEFIENTNLIWLLSKLFAIENITVNKTDLAYKWYIQFFTDPAFRQHKMMEFLYIRLPKIDTVAQYIKGNNNANENSLR